MQRWKCIVKSVCHFQPDALFLLWCSGFPADFGVQIYPGAWRNLVSWCTRLNWHLFNLVKTLLHAVSLCYSLQKRKRHCCRRKSIRRRCWSPLFCTSPLTYLQHHSTKMRKSSWSSLRFLYSTSWQNSTASLKRYRLLARHVRVLSCLYISL